MHENYSFSNGVPKGQLRVASLCRIDDHCLLRYSRFHFPVGKSPMLSYCKGQKVRYAAKPFTRRSHLPLVRFLIALRLYHGRMPSAGRTASCLTR